MWSAILDVGVGIEEGDIDPCEAEERVDVEKENTIEEWDVRHLELRS